MFIREGNQFSLNQDTEQFAYASSEITSSILNNLTENAQLLKDYDNSFLCFNSNLENSFLERKRAHQPNSESNQLKLNLMENCQFQFWDQKCLSTEISSLECSSIKEKNKKTQHEELFISQGLYRSVNTESSRTDSLPSISIAMTNSKEWVNEEEKMLNSWKYSLSNDFSNDLSSEILNLSKEEQIKPLHKKMNIQNYHQVNYPLNNDAELNLNEEVNISQEKNEEQHKVVFAAHKKCGAKYKKKNCCSCKKSNCLKLYCECFKTGKYCSGCTCPDCYNSEEFNEVRQKSIAFLKSKNQFAFKYDNDKEMNSIRIAKGCKCKNSNCQKNYCECYQSGFGCSESCKCQNCYNKGNCNY